MTTCTVTKAFISKNIRRLEKPLTQKIGKSYRMYVEFSITESSEKLNHVLLAIANLEKYLLISDVSPAINSQVHRE